MERTLVIIKPDCMNRSLAGEIIKRFESKGLKIAGIKMEHLKPEKLEVHYAHHKDKKFYRELVEYMSAIPSILIVLEGNDAVRVVRNMVGATLGRDAQPGTIRGDYSMSNQCNLVHASENVEIAEKEIKVFFGNTEIFSYDKMDLDWIYSSTEK